MRIMNAILHYDGAVSFTITDRTWFGFVETRVETGVINSIYELQSTVAILFCHDQINKFMLTNDSKTVNIEGTNSLVCLAISELVPK